MTTTDTPEINFALLTKLASKPHPLLNIRDDHGHECCPWDGEVFQEARNAHHLLDMIGIPAERGYKSDLDARTYLAIRAVMDLRERLDRVADWHSRATGPSGMVADDCTECGQRWPCDTRKMAEGTYKDED